MFPTMRRQDREITDRDRMIETLTLAEYGSLATAPAENGYPYVVALNHVLIGDNIYIHCANEGTKYDNLKRDPKVCFLVVRTVDVEPAKFTAYYESVMVFGQMTEVEEVEERRFVLDHLIKRFLEEDYPAHQARGAKYIDSMIDRTAIFSLSIEHMTGKAKHQTMG